MTLTAGEFERTSLVPLRGWGEGNLVRIVVEDETGTRLGHLIAPGDYTVKGLRNSARVERKPFRIVAGETTTVTIP